MAAYQYPAFSPEAAVMNGTKYAPDSPEALVMNGRPPLAAGPSDMDAGRPLNTVTVASNNALLRAQQARNPVKVGKQPTPLLDAAGSALSTILGIGDAEGARYQQPNAEPSLPDVGAVRRGPGPSFAITPSPRAAAAAKDAAAKESGVSEDTPSQYGLPAMLSRAADEWTKRSTANYGNEGRGVSALEANNQAHPTSAYAPDNGVYGPPEPEMTPQAQQLANMGVKDANRVVLQDKPGADKASGEAAINAGGGPRMLNYGDNTIVGESVNGSKKLNSFTGFGGTGAPAGAAGGAANPMQQAQAHLLDVMNQAAALRARGDDAGRVQAHALEGHVTRMSELFKALTQHAYSQGQLGVQQREVALREQEANPGIKIGNLQADEIGAGNLNTARKIGAAKAGQALNPAQIVPPMGYIRDPNTGEMVWKGFPTGPTAK